MRWDIGFIFLTLLAEIVGTIGGFGSSVFFVPIANFYFDFHHVLGLTAVLHLASNITKIVLFRKGFNRNLLLTMGIPSVLFVLIGGLLTPHMSSQILELILGIFLTLFSLFFIIEPKKVLLPTTKNAVLGGVLSGFSAGLMGTGGAIRGLTMAAFNLEKNVFIATSATIDLMIDTSRTVIYAKNGYVTLDIIYAIPVLIGISLLGSGIGKLLLRSIDQNRFKQIALFLILGIGLLTLGKVVFAKI
ncbi:sulfite exporter TauE/SafE family protein [Flavobacterium sp.]|uniref:sulfite exporter TauE/SafE family protein n=1 Tax=Flavobacterium sp. TaxID=239 RepID=UPI002609C171|nr:sulfite exporter TauE/SafE family protein [Flavobacterium sp.]